MMKCRLCDLKTSKGIQIFSKKRKKLDVSSIISQHFSLQLLETDKYSKLVCQKCWQITYKFHKLYSNVIKTVERQQNTIFLEKQIIDEFLTATPLKNEIKNENEFIDNYDRATIDTIVPIPRNNCFVRLLKTEGLLKDDTSPENDNIDEKLSLDSHETPIPSIVPIQLKKKRKRLKVSTVQSVELKKSIELKIIEEDKEIINFLGMNCDLCSESPGTFVELREHYSTKHRINGYLRCCDRKFFRRSQLYTHIMNHRFPNQYKCEFCFRSYIDKDCLDLHRKVHEPDAKRFQCSQCPVRYNKRRLLILHIQRVHGDAPRPFICDICNKNFSTKYGVTSHLQFMHTEQTHICDVCAKVFKTRIQLNKHYQINHMGVKTQKAQCTICGAWLTDSYCLRKHIRRHEDPEQPCTLCEKVYSNRDALASHMRNVHTNKQYQCPMCDKRFKSRIVLKEHINVHTGCTLYKCPYCPMEFKARSNMYKHRKTAHPSEWEQDRAISLNSI